MKAIRLENLGKRFDLTYQKNRVTKGILSALSRQKITAEFWALRDINMEVERGKVVGIIGRNGAGKSTLLNILAGIYTPTVGKVEIIGRVSSLLTLGAGFQDELTGKENIFLNSSILGMSRDEINKKYRDIVEFSELDGFLDSPLQTYSQGMRLRLGFSIAIQMDFDILLIDEILSVGDVSFQKKCFDKIEEFKKQKKTLVIVSQSLDIIERLCQEAFLLESGEIVQKSHPQKVVGHYLELLNEKRLPETFRRRYGKLRWWADKRFWEKKEGSKEARIVEVKTYNSNRKQTRRFKLGEKVTVRAGFVVDKEIEKPHFGIAIFREDGVYCYGPNTSFDGHSIDKLNKGEGFFTLEFKSLLLRPGKYRFSVAIWDKDELWAYDYHVGFYKFEIIGENKDAQLLNLRYVWEQEGWWQKFKITQSEEPDALFNLIHQSEDKISSSDVELSSFELLDLSGNPKSAFHAGGDFKIKSKFKFLKEPQDYYLWLGLFRCDDVYCHGVLKKLNAETATLIYPDIPLLTGDYYLSIAVWGKNQKALLLYKNKASVFKMTFLGEDHGTVYLEHSWKWRLL
ncbi:MAG: Wzt carbohydrate-binding domain-containing protein [Candidatus Omnitrophica bacterium]|nr:Wzt carbohydrate-binding domain-containing protein [Candidatus Omnitrophota bacterium]